MTPQQMHFDGETYNHERDSERLTKLWERVYGLMKDNEWRTIPHICESIQANSEASVSARLRDLRKPRFGGHTVERRYLRDGLWEYRIAP